MVETGAQALGGQDSVGETLGYFDGVGLTLVAGFAFVVRQTGEPGSIPVVALFISLPMLIQGTLALLSGSYRRVPELGWILTGMLEAMGLVFLLFLFF